MILFRLKVICNIFLFYLLFRFKRYVIRPRMDEFEFEGGAKRKHSI